jgi:hypothetical protein
MKYIFIGIHFIFLAKLSQAQFAPQVGNIGTTALYKDSSIFINWAIGCTLKRGWQNSADTSLGKTQVGDETYIVGKAGNGIASLGDGGEAIVTFAKPIVNGSGPDFAVFENGFIDQTLTPGTAFLELAFVSVSSDGVHYVRFPALSNIDTTMQLNAFNGIDASQIHNLAGKYLGNYGTPFDLSELPDTIAVDINNITHVKITDVVGSINSQYATKDSRGLTINDPWPTPFASGGFDLDAIGVIYQNGPVGINERNAHSGFHIYPIPAYSNQPIYIECQSHKLWHIELINLQGKTVLNTTTNAKQTNIHYTETGVYIMRIYNNELAYSQKITIQ